MHPESISNWASTTERKLPQEDAISACFADYIQRHMTVADVRRTIHS